MQLASHGMPFDPLLPLLFTARSYIQHCGCDYDCTTSVLVTSFVLDEEKHIAAIPPFSCLCDSCSRPQLMQQGPRTPTQRGSEKTLDMNDILFFASQTGTRRDARPAPLTVYIVRFRITRKSLFNKLTFGEYFIKKIRINPRIDHMTNISVSRFKVRNERKRSAFTTSRAEEDFQFYPLDLKLSGKYSGRSM